MTLRVTQKNGTYIIFQVKAVKVCDVPQEKVLKAGALNSGLFIFIDRTDRINLVKTHA
jgi:hypothetical protein